MPKEQQKEVKLIQRRGRPPSPKKDDPNARVKIGVTIDDSLWRRLRAYAMVEGRATADVLDEAIAEYLKRRG